MQEEPAEAPVGAMPTATPSAEEEIYPTVAATPAPDAGRRVLPEVQPRPNRLIIKNAEMVLVVSETEDAIDRLTLVVSDVGGSILSSRVWHARHQDENLKYASVTMGVPVDQFETTLRRLRQLAVRVSDETASGQDVTDEYVDLDSRLRNLEATRDRIREFLDQAQTVEEALRVNEQLKDMVIVIVPLVVAPVGGIWLVVWGVRRLGRRSS